MEHTLEQLHKAAQRLAQDGSVKDRLAEAFHHHLGAIPAVHLPEEYRPQFADMCRAMCSVAPMPRENPARAAVRKMSNADASRYASLIVDLFGATARAARSTLPPRLSTVPSVAPIVQLFAAEG